MMFQVSVKKWLCWQSRPTNKATLYSKNMNKDRTQNILTRSKVKHLCGVCTSILSRVATTHFNICNVRHKSTVNSLVLPSMYDIMIAKRQKEAQKSIVVELKSKDRFPSLCKICESYGTISKAIHYFVNNTREAVLIQYENKDSAVNLIRSCCNSSDSLPVQSRFLKFSGHKSEKESSSVLLEFQYGHFSSKPLLECSSVSEQLSLFHTMEAIDELGIRLRFMICQQLKDGLSGLFPAGQVLPFGSTLNGFGRHSSDLDMVLDFAKVDELESSSMNESMIFQPKPDRIPTPRIIDTLGDIMQIFMPSVSHIQRILRAKVPIIKFHHDLANIDCDLSLGNLSGFYMSELIHLLGHVDNRLYPLVFTLRRWAKANKITQPVPGRWISNFSLSLLVIFFLQNRTPPVLPTIKHLKDNASNKDVRITDDINCSFLRDISKIPKSQNSEDLGELLMEFFVFYGKFDFRDRALSIVTGNDFLKPDYSPIYIQNPLETELNVSKNVSTDEVDRFQALSRKSAYLLVKLPSETENWGIMALFGNTFMEVDVKLNNRIRVKDFFDTESVKSKTPKNMLKAEVIGLSKKLLSMNPNVKNKKIETKKSLELNLPIVNVKNGPPKTSRRNSAKSKKTLESIWKKW